MTFFLSACDTCGRHVFKAEDGIAYSRKNRELAIVDLKGEQPWSGIGMVCKPCLAFFGRVYAGDE